MFDLAAALPFIAPLLAKTDTPVPAGARWITVHPNGKGSKGTAVLGKEEKKGSGIWHVIAGAGGSLNYLKVRGVKSESDYRRKRPKKSVRARLKRSPKPSSIKKRA